MNAQLPPSDADFLAVHASDSFQRPPSAPFRVAAILGFLGVGFGAFGAHGLESHFESSGLAAELILERQAFWETAAHYHLVHAVALLAAAAACAALGRPARGVTWCFTLGVVVFSGTLYAMALGAPRWFGAITPIGGVLLLAGWLVLFARATARR